MKKIMIGLVSLALLLSGCGKQAETPETTNPTEEPTVAITEAASVDETTELPENETAPDPETDDPVSTDRKPSNRKPDPTEGSEPASQEPSKPHAAEPDVGKGEGSEPTPTELPNVTESSVPDETAGAEPSATEPPKVCQHNWTPVRNIPAEYDTKEFVVCSCGARFSGPDAWKAHRDSFLGTENLASHTGYSSGTEKVEVSPAMTVWLCTECGASKAISSWSNP